MIDIELLDIFHYCKQTLKDLGYKQEGIMADVRYNTRFTRCLGKCTRNTHAGTYVIQISETYYHHETTTEKEKIALMFHELIHTIKGCANHREPFNRVARHIEREEGLVDIAGATTNTNQEYKASKSKYKLVCNGCGTTSYRSRKLKYHIGVYSCKPCGSTLSLVTLR